MDEITILIGLGMVLVGIIIGYPLRHIFGLRDACLRFERHSERAADILNAEVIE